MGRGRPATIYAVAAEAGVSIATVSRVLRGTGPSSHVTRERVLGAVAELDYQPRDAARSLADQRTRALGMVLGDLAGPYYSDLVMGLEGAAARSGLSVVVQVADHRQDPDRAVRALTGQVDGLVVASSAITDDLLTTLSRTVPVVGLGRGPVAGCGTVATANHTAAHELTTHLLDHGRRQPVFVGDPTGSHDVTDRYAGFTTALGARGLPVPEPRRVPLTEDAGHALGAAAAADVRDGRVDAYVCANDELALALSGALRRRGLRVGRDVAVTGWDDVMAARYVTPGLSTVRQSVRRLGELAVALLHAQLSDEPPATGHEVLPCTVVRRGSCGCTEDLGHDEPDHDELGHDEPDHDQGRTA